MAKFRLIKYLLMISTVLVFNNCGYKFLNTKGTSVFIPIIQNSSLTPQLEIYLTNELIKVFTESPYFFYTSSEKDSDIKIKINIKKVERVPLFHSSDKIPNIVSAKFSIDTYVQLFKRDKLILEEIITENISASLVVDNKEEEVLKKISEKLSEKIYFWLLEKDGKKIF